MRIRGLLIMTAASCLTVCSVLGEPPESHCELTAANRLSIPPSSPCHEVGLAPPGHHSFPVLSSGLPDTDKDISSITPDSFRDNMQFSGISQDHSWYDFLDFVSGKTEETAKMTDPYYRHRYPEVSSNWKRLFYQKTPYYYRKGIELIHMEEGRIRVSLVKQKTNYNELVKGLWTEKAYDMVLGSNEGWLRNRAIFGGGRCYFLELSFHFE